MRFGIGDIRGRPELLQTMLTVLALTAVAVVVGLTAWATLCIVRGKSGRNGQLTVDSDTGSGRQSAARQKHEIVDVGQNIEWTEEYEWPSKEEMISEAIAQFRKDENWQACLHVIQKREGQVVERDERGFFIELYIQEVSRAARLSLRKMNKETLAKSFDITCPEKAFRALIFVERTAFLRGIHLELQRRRLPPELARSFRTVLLSQMPGRFWEIVATSPELSDNLCPKLEEPFHQTMARLFAKDDFLFSEFVEAQIKECYERQIKVSEYRSVVHRALSSKSQRMLWSAATSSKEKGIVGRADYRELPSIHRWIIANYVFKTLGTEPKTFLKLFDRRTYTHRFASDLERCRDLQKSGYRALLRSRAMQELLFEEKYAEAVDAFQKAHQQLGGVTVSKGIEAHLKEMVDAERRLRKELVAPNIWRVNCQALRLTGANQDPARFAQALRRVFPLKKRSTQQQATILICMLNRGRRVEEISLYQLSVLRKYPSTRPEMSASSKSSLLKRMLNRLKEKEEG